MKESFSLAILYGGKNCSTGQALIVADEVLRNPEHFSALLKGLQCEDSLVRMRVAYAIAKIAAARPDLLQPHKEEFITCLAAADNSHLARACMLQTLQHFELTQDDKDLLKDMLKDFMFSESSIVKTFSLQVLADFSEKDDALRQEVVPLLWNALERGTPAMRARARKLLKKYKL